MIIKSVKTDILFWYHISTSPLYRKTRRYVAWTSSAFRHDFFFISEDHLSNARYARMCVVNDPLHFGRIEPKLSLIRGRGPTILMSPFKTLMSWGSSLSLVLRKTRPTGVTRGSSRRVISPLPIIGLFFIMVANFQILNSLFLYPILF